MFFYKSFLTTLEQMLSSQHALLELYGYDSESAQKYLEHQISIF